MIKIIIKLATAVFLLISTFVNAQNFQGKAYYQTKRNINMSMDSTQVNNEMQKQLQEMLRKQFEKTYILTFNKTESIYKVEEELEKPQPTSSGIRIINGGAKDILYKNTRTNTFVNNVEQFGKKFLVKDNLKKIKWNITKETKMIGNYLCIKATTIKMVNDYDEEHNKKETKKEMPIEAWYTPEIPVNAGPAYYGNLPGLIIELHEDKMHYVCNKIVMNPLDKIEITVPSKGKVVNQKDFDAMVEKKRKEVMKNFQGGRKKGGNSNSFSIQIGG